MAKQSTPPPPPPAPVAIATPSRRALLVRAGVGLGAVMVSAVGGAFLMHASIDPAQDQGTGVPIRNESLAGVASWGMQLHGIDVAAAAASSLDLMVIDELAAGMRTDELAGLVKLLQTKPDGGRRLVLAHFAIGGDRADRGERRARFWEEAWQARIVGAPASALDRVLAAGFDGVYLDHGDVHLRWREERPSARDDMIGLVDRISHFAREWRPGFIVTLQNPNDLIASARLRGAIDAVAQSDLLFGAAAPQVPNAAADIDRSVVALKRARREGLPVLVVEYLTAPDKVGEARRALEEHGFLPYIAPRELDRLVPQD